MTYSRPGKMFYPTAATKAVVHGMPVIEENIPGVAIKQGAPAFGTGPAFVAGVTNPALVTIAIAEHFVILSKGIVEVPVQDISAGVKGDAVYITAATGVLTETSAGNVKFGRVVEVVGDGRGVPTGKVRIDLDAKDSF